MTDQKKTPLERLSDGYAASTPIKKPPIKAGEWPGGARAEDTEEMERVRASLSPSQRISVGYARLEMEKNNQ